MQYKDKILEYYQTGRYECDYETHLHLHQIIKDLNLYELLPPVDKQLQVLRKIKQLTQLNANCLDEDYDDEQGICQTFKIRSLLNQLSSKDIPAIIKECQSLNWQPYSTKIYKIFTDKPDYQAIIQRIQTTIHSQQFKIASMLFTALFDHVNGNKLTQFVNIYRDTMEYYLNFLNKQRNKFVIIVDNSAYSNLAQTQKVKTFVGSLFFIIRTCLRFCQILKILTGKNNLALKFAVVKKQIQKLMKKYPQWKFQYQKDDLFQILPLFKLQIKSQQVLNKNKICRWCFKELKYPQGQHSLCKLLINNKNLFHQ